MNGILLFKLFCTPCIIGLALVVSRRWGTFVGGCIVGLPAISGPISLSIALERGSAFAATVAYSALLGVAAVCLFTLTYVYAALRWPWYVALSLAELAFFVTGWGVGFVPYCVPLALFVGLTGPLFVLFCLPKVSAKPQPKRAQAAWIVPAQLLAGPLLVLLITVFAVTLGPQWSGVLSFYPVMITIMAPFCHATLGPAAARQLLAGLMTGFLSGTSFSTLVFFCVERLPLPLCYILATLLSFLVCIVISWVTKKYRHIH